MIKKADIVLIAFLIIFAFSFLFIFGPSKTIGGTVIIRVDNETYGEYNLYKDQTIEIKKNDKVVNKAVINNGKIKMVSATCPDQYCVRQPEVNKTSQTIVCLPNIVIIEVTEGEELVIDGLSQ